MKNRAGDIKWTYEGITMASGPRGSKNGFKTSASSPKFEPPRFERNWSKDIHNIESYIPNINAEDLEVRREVQRKFVEGLDPLYKEILRPIAETLAMLDGNAFFGSWTDRDEIEWYEQYLPEAYTLFQENGGIDGYPGEMGHVKRRKLIEANATTRELYEQLKVALILAGK